MSELEQALGQMGKALPEELTKRMSLNRFFAMQRDIVNDELEAWVPDLIEDALENPTGSYQLVSKYQNYKLDQIDKNNNEILTELSEIKKLLGKVGSGSDGGADGGGLLGNILNMLGLGGIAGAGARAVFGGNKKFKAPKRQTKLQKGLKLAKTGGKIGIGLALASYLFGDQLTDLDPAQTARDLGFEGLGDTIETVGGVGETALLSGASAAGMVKAKEFANKTTTPTATQTSSNYNNVVKDERLKGTKYYTQDPATGKTKFISMAEGAAAEKAGSVTYKGNATPSPTATPKTSMMSNISSAVKGGANKVWSSVKWVAGKAATPLMLATAVWDAWSQISALDKNLPRNEYASEVTKILADIVKTYGIVWVSAMLGSMIAGGVGVAAGGIGAIPGALIGFASGLILGGTIEYSIGDDISSVVNRVVDYVYGTGEYKQANQPQTVDTQTISGGVVNLGAGAQMPIKSATQTSNILAPGKDGVTKDELLVDEYNKLVKTGKVPQNLIDNLKEDMKDTKGLGTTIARNKIIDFRQKYVNGSTATPVTNEADLPAVNASPSSGQVATQIPTSPLTAAMSSLANLGGGTMAAGGATSGLIGGLMSNQSKLSNFAQLGMDKAKGLGGNIAALALGTGAVTGDKLKQLGIISPDASKEEVDSAVKEYSNMTKNAPTLSPQQMATETGTSQTAIQNMFAPSGRTVSENTIDNNPNAEFQKMIDQMMTKFQSENTGVVNNINAPVSSTGSMPKFTDLQTPTSMSITALRAQGLADVYSHPQAGSTIERSNRGGETTFI